jgi:outer membrane protein TolC
MKKYLSIFLLSFAVNSFAQNAFTLTDCIDYTLKNHPSVVIYKNNIDIAREKNAQNTAGYLPQISGVATTIDNLSLQSTILTADFIGPDPIMITMGSQFTTNAYVDISQSLIDLTKMAKIGSNKANREKSILEHQLNEENITYTTAASFFQILIIKEQLKILQANKAKYEEMHKVLQYQNQMGTVLEKEVSRIQVNLNSASYQIQDAETRLKFAYNALKNAMGMPIESPLEIQAAAEYESYIREQDDTLGISSLTNYKLGENAVLFEKLNLRAERAGYYPTLTAVGRFGYQSLTNESSDIYKDWNDFSYIGLSLNVPIFNGLKKRSQVSESRLKLENQAATFKLNTDKLQLAYENSKTSLGSAHSNFNSSKDNMGLARQVLEVTEFQYKKGVASLTDYLNDDTAYRNAQGDYLNSLYNLLISELNYHQSKGTLKEFISRIK